MSFLRTTASNGLGTTVSDPALQQWLIDQARASHQQAAAQQQTAGESSTWTTVRDIGVAVAGALPAIVPAVTKGTRYESAGSLFLPVQPAQPVQPRVVNVERQQPSSGGALPWIFGLGGLLLRGRLFFRGRR